MKVFFTSSFSGKKNYQKNYDTIIESIRSNDAEVISLEAQSYSDLLNEEFINNHPHNIVHYTYIQQGIQQADAVIIEISYDSFQMGHEATLALVYDKPLLCVSCNKDYSTTITHPKFQAVHYQNLDELKDLVNEFIIEVKNKTPKRFTMLLPEDVMNLLDKYHKKTGVPRSEYIRNLIRKDLNSWSNPTE